MWVCVVFFVFACLIFYYFVIYLTSNFNKPRFLLFLLTSSLLFFFLSFFLYGVAGVSVCVCGFSLACLIFILALN